MIGTELAVLDAFFAILVLVAAIRATLRGFIAEVASMAAVILGIGAAIGLNRTVAPLVARVVPTPVGSQIVAFLLVFLVVYLMVKMVEGLLHALFERFDLDRVDRTLGLFVGLAEGALLVALLVVAASWLPVPALASMLRRSAVARFTLSLLRR